MFMWWKGKLQPGNYDKLISAMDFYPTALDAADISIPKDLKLDGVSLLPWLQDKKQGEPHKNLTWITSYSHWFDEEIFHSGIITTNLFAISQTITRITPTLRT